MGAGTAGAMLSRRKLFLVAAAVISAVGAVVATACSRPKARPEAVVEPSTPQDVCAQAIARTTDIPVGGGAVFADRRVVVTQPAAGEFRGFGIVCTHDGCELNQVSGGTINCPCHGSRYSIVDGSVVQGPARTGLRQETVSVDNDCVVLL